MADETTQETEKKKSAKDKSKNQVVLAMDADRIGLATGALVATIVMALSFLQQADGLAVSFRTGIAFVGAYGATFFFIRVILRSTIYELIIGEKVKTRTKLGRGPARSDEETQYPSDMPMTEDLPITEEPLQEELEESE